MCLPSSDTLFALTVRFQTGCKDMRYFSTSKTNLLFLELFFRTRFPSFIPLCGPAACRESERFLISVLPLSVTVAPWLISEAGAKISSFGTKFQINFKIFLTKISSEIKIAVVQRIVPPVLDSASRTRRLSARVAINKRSPEPDYCAGPHFFSERLFLPDPVRSGQSRP